MATVAVHRAATTAALSTLHRNSVTARPVRTRPVGRVVQLGRCGGSQVTVGGFDVHRMTASTSLFTRPDPYIAPATTATNPPTATAPTAATASSSVTLRGTAGN